MTSVAGGVAFACLISPLSSSCDCSAPSSSKVSENNGNPSLIRIHTSLAIRHRRPFPRFADREREALLEGPLRPANSASCSSSRPAAAASPFLARLLYFRSTKDAVSRTDAHRFGALTRL